MDKRTCGEGECGRAPLARGLCNMHYQRLRSTFQPKGTCKERGCGNVDVLRRGWCPMHYQRWRKNGNPSDHGSIIVGNDGARFWEKVSRSNGCWLWTSTLSPDGYGHFGMNGKPALAHRVAYELLVGPISDGLTLDHLCRVRACVRPDHLEPVTMKDNILRGESPSAINARKTHCVRGHPFDATNTYVTREGWRRCRKCQCLAQKRYVRSVNV